MTDKVIQQLMGEVTAYPLPVRLAQKFLLMGLSSVKFAAWCREHPVNQAVYNQVWIAMRDLEATKIDNRRLKELAEQL